MTPIRFALPFALFLAAGNVVAAPTVRDFQLPPSPTDSPSPSPQVQGPVDPEAPIATRPRPVETATPAPTRTATPTARPAAAEPARRPAAAATTPGETAPQSSRPAATPPVSPQQSAAAGQDASASLAEPPGAADVAAPATATGSITPDAAPSPIAGSVAQEPALDHPAWRWLAALAALLVILAGAALVWRRRGAAVAGVPTIEPPLLRAQPAPPPVDTPAPTLPAPTFGSSPAAPRHGSSPTMALRIEATPSHLTRSLMAATFTCRVALVNRGDTVLENVMVELDMITAHGSVPTTDQVADPARPLPEAGRFARIAPGESVEFARDVRMATAEIRTLRQGSAQLYVPLLRVRAVAEGQPPVARTFIVGTLPEEGAKKLQPFRLDEMPQTYRAIGVAALD